ncbi:MAG: hypothetical protein IJO36_06710 [Clostridia bacterium]|nr:hypothetical protein [Clostridia bacterium]
MSLEKIPIISKTVHFSVERSPDDTGIVFTYKQNNRKKVAAMLIDQGDYFDFVTIDHRGIDMTEFNPETVLMLKSGKPAPLESEQQMEVDTPFGRQLIVRHLYADERPAGVIVACKQDNLLISVLVCGETEDNLCFMLAK